jgi:nitronate monooxygenase
LGYLLDRNGCCSYHKAWEDAPVDEKGKKLPITEKMCICYHFMKYDCYTCGHNVYRLKDTSLKLENGLYHIPSAEHIFNDYRFSEEHEIAKPIKEAQKENASHNGKSKSENKPQSVLQFANS